MRIIARAFAVILILLGSLLVIAGIDQFFYTPEQMEKGERFRDKEMAPAVEFIETFIKSKGKLPSKEQFSSWKDEHDLDNRALFLYTENLPDDIASSEGTIPAGEFAISAWRGEWDEYYFSWSKEYTADDYGWVDGLTGLIICALVGLVLFLTGVVIINKTPNKSFKRDHPNRAAP